LDHNCQKYGGKEKNMEQITSTDKKKIISFDTPSQEPPKPVDIIKPNADKMTTEEGAEEWAYAGASYFDLSSESFLLITIGAIPVALVTDFDWSIIIPYLGLGLGLPKLWDMIGTYIATSANAKYYIELIYGKIGQKVGDAEIIYDEAKNLIFWNGLAIVSMASTWWVGNRLPFMFEFILPINLIIGGAIFLYDGYQLLKYFFPKVAIL
jgi:hypothetical protein